MSEGSKPWWQWISKDDLRLLREYVQKRKPKRNSLELAKDTSLTEGLEKKKSILRKPSMKPETEDDTRDGIQVNFNDDFVESETKVKTKEELDYAYHGYTLEITDKVRLIQLPLNNRTHNRRVSFHHSVITMDSD